MKTYHLIIKNLIKNQINNRKELASFKNRMAKKYNIACPSNVQLLKAYHELLKEKRILRRKRVEKLLRTKPVRSLSGIVNVSVLTKPYPCPGKCIYCPMEEGFPKSYLSGEPAAERAKALGYKAYLQTKKRVERLRFQGHPTDKIELRIIGGTWSYYPSQYQENFIKECFEACNQRVSKNLKEAQKLNEKSKRRIIGLSIETRPDFINKKEIKQLRRFGVTKVELGVQSIYEDVLRLNRRGHGREAIIKATQLLKRAGFKVSYQIMPNLPGSNPERDRLMAEELFQNSSFRPDFLKIYPCALLKEAPLYQWYQEGKYKPYSEKTLIEVIKNMKASVPYYVRIERVLRDIPSPRITTGPTKISNLRQVIKKRMRKEGKSCRCIRCREVRSKSERKGKILLYRQDYQASGGREIFLTFENKGRNKLYSLLRLRLPSLNKVSLMFPVLEGSALIREVHTYGQLVSLSQQEKAPQHRGLGRKLIQTAENISRKEFCLSKIAVIAAVGTREYYRKLGYQLKDTYMIKRLDKSRPSR